MKLTELRFQDPGTKTYLGSPSLVRAPDGAWVASHDYFGPGCPRNHENEESLTSIYRSEDDGSSWKSITHLTNAYWGTLFAHAGALWHFGVTQQYGSICIRRSDDNGFTWSHPKDDASGLLFRGGAFHANPNYHCAPVPVLIHNGRLWRAFEDCREAKWGSGFHALMLSAPLDADLLRASSWTMSEPLAFNQAWLKPEWTLNLDPRWPASGWLEGNAVATPDGGLANLIRFYSPWVSDIAAWIDVSPDGKELSFDPRTGYVPLPGGRHKFQIRRDPSGGKYFAMANPHFDHGKRDRRNRLDLLVSEDLRSWKSALTVVEDDSPLTPEESIDRVGFQYPDWQFDGDDLVALVRTAYNGAHNFHDSNRITFHRVPNFRRSLP